MAAQGATTPTRSPGAFTNRFALGGQTTTAGAAATTDDVGPPWPQASQADEPWPNPGTPPPGMQSGAAQPASIHIHSTPGAASHLGEPAQDQMTEVERLKAQIETMVAVMQQLSAQVEKLMSTPSSSWAPTTPAPAPAMTAPAPAMPAPAPAPTPQPQSQQQAGPPDPWQGSWQRFQQAQQAGSAAAAQPGKAAPPPPLAVTSNQSKRC